MELVQRRADDVLAGRKDRDLFPSQVVSDTELPEKAVIRILTELTEDLTEPWLVAKLRVYCPRGDHHWLFDSLLADGVPEQLDCNIHGEVPFDPSQALLFYSVTGVQANKKKVLTAAM